MIGLTEEWTMLAPFLNRTLWDFEIVVKDSLRRNNDRPTLAGAVVSVRDAS